MSKVISARIVATGIVFVLQVWVCTTGDAGASSPKDAVPPQSVAKRQLLDLAYHQSVETEHPNWKVGQITDAIKKDPKNAGLYVDLAHVYFLDGDVDMSFANIDKAIGIDPRCARAYVVRSMLYAGLDKYKQAFQDLDTATKFGTPLVATDATARAALLHRELKEYDVSLKLYNQIINSGLCSKQRLALMTFQRGEIYYRTQKWAPAEADLNAAIKMDPGLEIFHLILARLHALRGKEKEAIADYTVVIDMENTRRSGGPLSNSDAMRAYSERAALYDRTGRPDLAKLDRNSAATMERQHFDMVPFRAN